MEALAVLEQRRMQQSKPEFVVVNLTSVYGPASSIYALKISTHDLRKVGWSVEDMIKRIEGSFPDERKSPSSEDTRPIPGCDEYGAFVDSLDPEAFPEPGNNGLSWECVPSLANLTAACWCVVISAALDN
jgi:hypothetical protein